MRGCERRSLGLVGHSFHSRFMFRWIISFLSQRGWVKVIIDLCFTVGVISWYISGGVKIHLITCNFGIYVPPQYNIVSILCLIRDKSEAVCGCLPVDHCQTLSDLMWSASHFLLVLEMEWWTSFVPPFPVKCAPKWNSLIKKRDFHVFILCSKQLFHLSGLPQAFLKNDKINLATTRSILCGNLTLWEQNGRGLGASWINMSFISGIDLIKNN